MKKIKISTAIGLLVMAVATTVNITLLVSYDIINERQGEYQTLQQELSKIYEVMQIIDENYVGEYDINDALDMASAGFVSGISDRWSYYLTKEQYQEYISADDSNLVGVGINVVYDEEEQAIFVTNVYNNSPASGAGVEKFDYIVAVDGILVADIGYQESVDLVTGERGTIVSLDILRNGLVRTIEVERDIVAKVSVNYEMFEDNIAYVQITSFETETANQFNLAIENMIAQGAEGFIFDVRNNPGGYLTKLVEMLDVLLPEGNIISTVSKAGKEEIYSSNKDMLDLPISVLVNSNSYSAAEFFAVAIQEYKVGTIIGENTTGKGYSQSPVELSDGSAIILSTNKYYTPNGNNLAGVGVTPDILVELSEEENQEFYFLTTETDPQIQAGIKSVLEKISK